MRVFLSLYWEKCEKSMKIANTSDNPPFTTSFARNSSRRTPAKRKRKEERGEEERTKGPGGIVKGARRNRIPYIIDRSVRANNLRVLRGVGEIYPGVGEEPNPAISPGTAKNRE